MVTVVTQSVVDIEWYLTSQMLSQGIQLMPGANLDKVVELVRSGYYKC